SRPGAKRRTISFLVAVRPVRSQCEKFQGAAPEPQPQGEDTKMNGSARYWALGVVLTSMVLALNGCSQLEARDQLNKGVDAYKSAHYEEAIEHFQKATELDPK